MHRGQKPSLPSPATLEISRKDRIRRQGQMPQGAELLCLVGSGHGHPAPSVPLQVMQQIASGFKSAEVTSATLSAADAALAPRHRYFRRRLVHDCRPGWELVRNCTRAAGGRLFRTPVSSRASGSESSGSLPEQTRFEISVSPCTGRGEGAQPIAISREDQSLIRDPSQSFRDLPSAAPRQKLS